ncbi:hypothetical protein BDZ88DRAFT_23698 [Geranomyces variabilis]|nr:hypothetical protein BDZ88DRAFT_23698 [Geranomyces variabilis]KAJ3138934.1 hypothetical protein HDU90_000839 [Geranomyces variabilis]
MMSPPPAMMSPPPAMPDHPSSATSPPPTSNRFSRINTSSTQHMKTLRTRFAAAKKAGYIPETKLSSATTSAATSKAGSPQGSNEELDGQGGSRDGLSQQRRTSTASAPGDHGASPNGQHHAGHTSPTPRGFISGSSVRSFSSASVLPLRPTTEGLASHAPAHRDNATGHNGHGMPPSRPYAGSVTSPSPTQSQRSSVSYPRRGSNAGSIADLLSGRPSIVDYTHGQPSDAQRDASPEETIQRLMRHLKTHEWRARQVHESFGAERQTLTLRAEVAETRMRQLQNALDHERRLTSSGDPMVELQQRLADTERALEEERTTFNSRFEASEAQKREMQQLIDGMEAERQNWVKNHEAEAADRLREAEKTYQDEKQRLSGRLAASDAKTRQLHQMIQDLENERQSHTQESAQSHEAERDALKQTIRSLEGQVRELHSTVATLEESRAHLSSSDAARDAEHRALNEKVEALEDRARDLQQIIDASEERHYQDKHQVAQTIMSHLRIHMEKEAKARQQALQERDEARAEISERDARIAELSAERDAMQATIVEREAEVAHARNERDRLQAAIAERDGEITQLTAGRDSAHAVVAERDAAIVQLQTDRDAAHATIAEREGELFQLKADHDAAQAALTERDAEIAKLKTDHTTEMQETYQKWNNAVSELEAEIWRITTLHDTTKSAAEQSQAQIESVTAERDNALATASAHEQRISDLTAELDAERAVKTDGDTQITQLTHERDSAQAALYERELQIANLGQERDAAAAQLSAAAERDNAQISTLLADRDAALAVAEARDARIEHLTTERDAAVTAAGAAQARIAALETQLSDMTAEHELARGVATDESQAARREAEERAAAATADLQLLRTRIEQLDAEVAQARQERDRAASDAYFDKVELQTATAREKAELVAAAARDKAELEAAAVREKTAFETRMADIEKERDMAKKVSSEVLALAMQLDKQLAENQRFLQRIRGEEMVF